MKANKAIKLAASIVKDSAVKNAGATSRFFTHQPKVPAKLLEMKNK